MMVHREVMKKRKRPVADAAARASSRPSARSFARGTLGTLEVG
jgi:hypothetical protein